METKIKIGISKKIIGAQGVGFFLFLLLAVFSYISLTSYAAMHKRSNELTLKIELAGDLQDLLQKILMPPNDYLITGDIKERRNLAALVTETAAIFEKVRLSANKTKEEMAIIAEVEKGFIELQQKAMVLISTERPVGNKEAAALMKEMDAFGEGVEKEVEKLHTLIKIEMEEHNKRVHAINSWTFDVFISLIFIALSGMILLFFLVRRKIVMPLLELAGAALAIGKGNLEYRVKINTGDELEYLGNEFNDMAQSMQTKTDEVKIYSDKLAETNRLLDQNILQLYALYNISKTISATLEMEKLLSQVVDGVSRALKLHKINVMLITADGTELYIVSGTGISDETRNIRFKMGDSIYGWLAITGEAELINDPFKHPKFKPTYGLDDDVSSLICAPFKGRGQVIGVMNAYRVGGDVFDEASYELLIATAGQIGIALENVRLFEATKVLAITDGMTSLYNYRYFAERLNEEFERAGRYKRELSIIMMDIDFFKKYNDAQGHPKGDELLRNFAGILKKVMRNSDIIARYGGEEFIVILTETSKNTAIETAERLRKAVESSDFEGGGTQPGGRVTVSIGVASHTDGPGSPEELVKSADAALYRAKEEGRNRVCA